MKIKMAYVVACCVISFSVMADEREEIEARIKPVGQVQIDGDESTKIKVALPVDAKTEKKSDKVDGEAIYNKYCVTCHKTGLAGAPLFRDKAAWAARQKQGMDTLLKHAVSGLRAMPPKGTCMSCSEPELKAAIEYMLPK